MDNCKTFVITCPDCGEERAIRKGQHRRCPLCRFRAFIVKPEDPDACWGWTGARHRGYGIFRWNERAAGAHRISYELQNGPIPAGLDIDHICHTRECTNPKHLRAVTVTQNNHNHNGARKTNKVGVRGVSMISPTCWAARVDHLGVVHKTYHRTLEEAAEAARLMRLQYHTHNDADRVQSVARVV